MQGIRLLSFTVLLLAFGAQGHAQTSRYCIDGEYDLGARYQGLSPQAGELYPATWCVTTDDSGERVLLQIDSKSNPDMDGSWSLALIAPDLVRIVNDEPPDIEFRTPDAATEVERTRLLDPRFADPLNRAQGNNMWIKASVELPLRGKVPVTWHWTQPSSEAPGFSVEVDGQVIFSGTGSRHAVSPEDAAALWEANPGAEPAQVPGDRWPSRIAMELVSLTDDVYIVTGVRTGFHHMVVRTSRGLVVADAPAGWVELHQFPPTDMVANIGVSGLSEQLIDFLAGEFPGSPIRAVALTHHHDDHAGGARAFAAAGADVYAPAEVADFLGEALNRDTMPTDRLSATNGVVEILPVTDSVRLRDDRAPVTLLSLGESPHVMASIGVLSNGYFYQADLHVPNSDADEPRADRTETECWFAGWAVDNLPADTVVINTHSLIRTPVSRLANYLESDSC